MAWTKRLRCGAVGAIAMIGLMGCLPNNSSAPPSETTSSSGSATPSQAPSSAPSVTEAEAVFRDYWKADLEVSKAGGAQTLPPSLRPYVMGEFAIGTERRHLQEWSKKFQMRDADQARITWIRAAPHQPQGAVVAIDVCTDLSKVQEKFEPNDWLPGEVSTSRYYLRPDEDGKLKIDNGNVLVSGACASSSESETAPSQAPSS